LSKDEEDLPATGAALIYLAMSRFMVKRLAAYHAWHTASNTLSEDDKLSAQTPLCHYL
jgi:hypothetical protein